MKRIATIALLCGDRLLIGRRSDDGRWNLPGGHVDEGETPEAAAKRELEEETGICLPDCCSLSRLCSPKTVTTYTGKTLEIHPFFSVVPTELPAHRVGTDPGEAHDWSWVNVSNGLPPDISMNWHNKTDAALEALGIGINQVDIDKQDVAKSDDLEKAWPKHYNRVQGQDKNLGVSSEKQKRFMQAVASGKASGHAPSSEEAKDYLKNTGDHKLPESGTDGARGKREKDRHEKRKAKEKEKEDKERSKKDKANKADDSYNEHRQGEQIKRENRPKVTTFSEQIRRVKQKFGDKKPKTFEEQVAEIKDRYKSSLTKSADLFYAKVEGCLKKGVDCEELLSHMMDMDLILDDGGREALYKSADKLFDAVLTPEEQVVYELSYMANDGCENSLNALVKFTEEMGEELLKSITVEDAVAELMKAKTDQIKGGLADSKKPNDFDEKSLEAGIKVEMEHTNDRAVAREIAMDHLTEDPDYYKKLKTIEKSADNSKVVGKKNGHSVRKVHGYYRYTSGPKRGEYVHRHEAEKRLGRKLKTKEHVDHANGNRGSTRGKVMSASAHAAKTNKTRANGKGYSGNKRYEHTRD